MMHEPPEAHARTNVIHLGDYPQRLARLESDVAELKEMRAAIGPVFRQAAKLGGATLPAQALETLEAAFDVRPGHGVIDVLLNLGDRMERIEVDTDKWPHADPEAVLAALIARPCGA